MRQKPLIMSAWSVSRILAGRKTETRRIVVSEKRPFDPGDMIWVKECWAAPGYDDTAPSRIPRGAEIHYKATCKKRMQWRNPLFMPKRIARLWLGVEKVYKDKLHNMTKADAMAEGIEFIIDSLDPLEAFMKKWDDLNKDRGFGWETDPEVWVIKFRALSDFERSSMVLLEQKSDLWALVEKPAR